MSDNIKMLAELREFAEEVRSELNMLCRLLDDAHPGLATWNMMLARRLEALAAVLNRRPS